MCKASIPRTYILRSLPFLLKKNLHLSFFCYNSYLFLIARSISSFQGIRIPFFERIRILSKNVVSCFALFFYTSRAKEKRRIKKFIFYYLFKGYVSLEGIINALFQQQLLLLLSKGYVQRKGHYLHFGIRIP